MLDIPPIGLVIFPGSGVADNLADGARQMCAPRFDDRPNRPAGA